ncbi:MAG: lysophospholipase [Crenarchaeota archaeon]|nr:lysophospholipase [Thermoproteota archaeon]MDW8033650.1 alpha/beta hydrolase [Nitrososphaerota archaeon]
MKKILICIHGASSHSKEFSHLGEYLSSKDVLSYAMDSRSNGQSGGEYAKLSKIG